MTTLSTTPVCTGSISRYPLMRVLVRHERNAAGHQNAFLSVGQNQPRPADYLQPVAEALSIPLGAYGAGQMMGEGYQTARQANSLMDLARALA